jgi:hypothetical protein
MENNKIHFIVGSKEDPAEDPNSGIKKNIFNWIMGIYHIQSFLGVELQSTWNSKPVKFF